jgi:glucose/arabinose dehydrogenase
MEAHGLLLNKRMGWRTVLTWLSVLLPMSLAAQPADLQLTQISSIGSIVDIANAGDGSDRLFLVRQAGTIFVMDKGRQETAVFLSIQDRVTDFSQEQGLLSVAFAPDYGDTGYFYVWYTALSGGTVLSRFQVSEDPNVADPDSEEILLIVTQPFDNHNGGRLRFGPDGMLYLGLGDGGGSFDPEDNGQDGSTLLGKLIRIDVDPAHGTYAIPPDNPFVGNGSVRDEIWALGLRNPWRISFDRQTGDLFIADVGQNRLEEVNVQPSTSPGGENYGWDIMEGSECSGGGDGCVQAGLTLPVAEYDHDLGCSITGGEVYRGTTYPNMDGTYFYGDFCSGRIWGLRRDGDGWTDTVLAETPHNIVTFGLDEDGNVYLSNQFGGVFLLSDGEPVSEGFEINAGLNDAWFSPVTAGQGFFIVVLPDTKIVFLAWFTYDVGRPPEGATAILGEPGHRWLTAQGPYSGDTATLDLYVSSGGVFDSALPAVGPPEKVGTMTITWSDCEAGLVEYEITSLGLSGEIPIERIVPDNVALCEALQ